MTTFAPMKKKGNIQKLSYKNRLGIWLTVTLVSFAISETEDWYTFPILFEIRTSILQEIIENFIFCSIFSYFSVACSYYAIPLTTKRNEWNKKNMILASAIILLINFILSLILTCAYSFLLPNGITTGIANDITFSGIVSALCSFIIIIIVYNEILSELNKQQKIDRTKLLRHQLNPHFMFNSMNILVGLIDEDPNKAINFTIKLSRFYRFITQCIDNDKVAVASAITFAQNYVDLLNIRYNNTILIDIEGSQEGYIIPMAMQVMIENAVKHNRPSKDNKLFINITCDCHYLTVSNNLNEKETGKYNHSTGIGLRNIIKQYELLGDALPVVKKKDRDFSVSIPILKSER